MNWGEIKALLTLASGNRSDLATLGGVNTLVLCINICHDEKVSGMW